MLSGNMQLLVLGGPSQMKQCRARLVRRFRQDSPQAGGDSDQHVSTRLSDAQMATAAPHP